MQLTDRSLAERVVLEGILGGNSRVGGVGSLQNRRPSSWNLLAAHRWPFHWSPQKEVGFNGHQVLYTQEGGSPPVTRGRVSKMSKTEEFSKLTMQVPSIPRPGSVNQHSNSLPSTPYRQSRKLSFDSRSPSPEKVDGDGSPRSVKSESDSGFRLQGTGSLVVGCKYETGMAFSRRRIPYSVGGDLLERPKSMPKKYLNPMEENKLSGDMRELYDRILPSTESEARRAKFVQKLEKILNERWPHNEIKVHVFGSSGNMLCTSDSDGQYRKEDTRSIKGLTAVVDICITTPMKKLERVCLLAEALAERRSYR